jgi:hypothetical protein
VDGEKEELLSEADLQAYLEANLGNMVQILIVSGNLEYKSDAEEQNVSAGLLKVQELSQELEVDSVEEVAKILEEEAAILVAPILKSTTLEKGLRFTWNKLDFSKVGYEGQVIYSLMAADSMETLNTGGGAIIKSFEFMTTGTQPIAYDLMASAGLVKQGEVSYYLIKARYGDLSTYGNKIKATMPKEEKVVEATCQVTGEVEGDGLQISWEKETGDGFQGYKVVASKDNPNPRYPEDGYVEYISNSETTSQMLYASDGFSTDRDYYFSVTYLFQDGGMKYGNSVRLRMPEKEDQKVSEPVTQQTYISTTIKGSQSGPSVNLSWNEIDRSSFDGYKVMYSFTDSNPVYGDGSKYYRFITNPATTSVSLNMSELSGYTAGAKCYLSITALYDGHDVKKAGNVISFTDLGVYVEPSEDYVSTTISGSQSGETINLVWNKISHSNLDGYKVMYSFTDANPVYGDGSKYYQWITDPSKTGVSLNITKLSGYTPGDKCYFSITALYDDHAVKKAGNVISFTAPGAYVEPSGDYVSTTISGSQSDETIDLAWGKIYHNDLDGYKVMYSYTDSEPVYGDGSSYYQWITDSATNSLSLDMTSLSGFAPGERCYFSITALYDGYAVKKAGNVISFEAPEGTADLPEDYMSSTITGSQSGNAIALVWERIDHSQLDGYKVMYSYTDTEPVYGDGSSYYRWITEPSTTGLTLDMSTLGGYAPGETCYFSITALYDGHDVKMPGNVVSFTALE